MGQWTEAIRGHTAWKTLETLGPAIDGACERDGLTAESLEELARIRAVLTFCGKRLAASDPLLTSSATLDEISLQFATTTTALVEFTKTGEAAHLTTATSAAALALEAANGLSVPQTPDELTGLGEAAAIYQTTLSTLASQAEASVAILKKDTQEAQSSVTSLGEAATTLRTDLTTMRQELAALTEAVSTLVTKHEALFAQSETQRSETARKAEEARQTAFQSSTQTQLSEFNSTQTERQTAYNAQSTQHEALFTAAQQERLAQHTEAQGKRESEFASAQAIQRKELNDVVDAYKDLLKNHEETLSGQAKALEQEQQANVSSMDENYKKAAQAILDAVNEHKREVEKVAGVVGNLAVTSGYQRVAKSAGIAKIWWQVIAVLALACLSVFAVVTAASTSASWQTAASHLISFLPIIVLAAFAGSQADKNHQIEKRNQKLALELEAIGPYLAPLSKEAQEKFRIEVGERTFGRDDGSHVPEAEKMPVTVPARPGAAAACPAATARAVAGSGALLVPPFARLFIPGMNDSQPPRPLGRRRLGRVVLD